MISRVPPFDSRLGAGTLALVAALLLAACDGRGRESAGPAPELLHRVTNAYPAYSPDGRWLAYMSNADGDFDIYAMSPLLGIRRRLTDAPGRDGTPVWSPDGTRIAFQSFRDGNSQIYVMNADGSGQRNLSSNQWADEHPFWSSDGQRLLFASNRSATPEAPDNVDIFEMRADGRDVRRVTRTREVETYPSWSPDGSRITARRVMGDGNWEVVVMNADGSDARVPAPHPGFDGWPVWSPDGERIAFSSERAGSADLYLIDLASDGLNRLTWDDERDERQPFFSPDGRFVAYARYVWFPNQPFYEASDIYAIRVAEDE